MIQIPDKSNPSKGQTKIFFKCAKLNLQICQHSTLTLTSDAVDIHWSSMVLGHEELMMIVTAIQESRPSIP